LKTESLFDQRLRGAGGAVHQDIVGHLPVLAFLAAGCDRIAEFGVRTGNSTVAFLHGMDLRNYGDLYSYDIMDPQLGFDPLEVYPDVHWHFTKCDTSRLETIPEVDLLFVDTRHTFDQVSAELVHARSVGRYLVFHDTELNREQGEHGEDGIWEAITQFLKANKDWEIRAHFTHCNGLTILAR
jgi:cephalosporin hydroxylase